VALSQNRNLSRFVPARGWHSRWKSLPPLCDTLVLMCHGAIHKKGWWAGKINVLAVASHGHRRSCSDTQRHRENATGGYCRRCAHPKSRDPELLSGLVSIGYHSRWAHRPYSVHWDLNSGLADTAQPALPTRLRRSELKASVNPAAYIQQGSFGLMISDHTLSMLAAGCWLPAWTA
jgi:hypothetical protein